jgi:NitT/TauT family transport system substrate-binding protein
VLEENLQDPAFVDKMARFVRASMRGWQWAKENQEEAAAIVLDNDETGAQTIEHQTRMVGEIANLITDDDPSSTPPPTSGRWRP